MPSLTVWVASYISTSDQVFIMIRMGRSEPEDISEGILSEDEDDQSVPDE
jgi:hypothetical protein